MPRKSTTRVSGNTTEIPNEQKFVNNKISLDELIPVVSLVDYPLNLLSNGRSAKYRFENFGQTKQIIYQDILQIIEQYQAFMQQGYFMILDERVIGRHGLQEIQSKLLSKEKLEKILNGDASAVSIFKSSSESQKNMIIGMMTRKLSSDPKSIDLNIVDEISRIAKINIQQNAEESRVLYTKEEVQVEE